MQIRFDGFAAALMALVVLFAVSANASANSYENALSSAQLGDTGQLVNLLQRGIDPDTVDAQGNTLLIIAAREGHASTVEALLKHRADVSRRNQAGDSALMLGVLKGERGVVDTLLAAGAPVNHDGWTPLLYAAFEGRVEILNQLLARDADVNALAPNESNALMLAARNGNIEVVRRLLETDIDLYQENDRGMTAVTWALENGNTDIADLIRDAQAQRPRPASDSALRIEVR